MTGTDIHYAALILKRGGMVSIPTETVYGLAVSAYDLKAIAAVFKAKERPLFDPLIVHIGKREQVIDLFSYIPDIYLKLMEIFWPGPLTLIANKSNKVPFLVTAGSDMVAVRMPNHPLTLELLSMLDFPLVAPSANPFGYVSPTTAAHVEKQLKDKIDYILDGGKCKVGIESTIIGLNEGKIEIWRLGGVEIGAIEKVIGYKPEIKIQTLVNPKSPGQIAKHYSPGKPIILVSDLKELENTVQMHSDYALLCYGEIEKPDNCSLYMNLSWKTDDLDGASCIYESLRRYADAEENLLIALLWPDKGLGAAINDRLKRAASK